MMATGGSEERHVLTILWRIKNIGVSGRINRKGFLSPVFRARTLNGNTFQMFLWPKGETGKDENINLQLDMLGDPLDFPIDCEWSFIGSNRSPLVSGTIRYHVMVENETLFMSDCPTHEEVFVTSKSEFIFGDTLTVRFCIWQSDANLSTNEFISCSSRLETTNHSFLWTVPRFSALQLNQKMTTPVRFGDNPALDNILLKFSLKGETREDAMVSVKLTPCYISDVCLVTLEVSALDNKQKVIASTKIERKLFSRDCNESCTLPELVSRKELLRKKSDVLRNDNLTLRCELLVSFFVDFIDTHYHGFSNLDVHSIGDFSTLLDASCQTSEQSVEPPNISLERKDSLRFLGEDLLSLYIEQSLTDFELHSGDVSFPVHKNILSARSPVFKAMFSSGMKESDSDTQDIPDLDVHTLNRMLTFLYGGTVEPDLHFEKAIKLYYAADKYQIESLKQQCSSVLQSFISVANVSDILILAETHRDEQLWLSAHDFFLENFDEIIKSEEWETFQQREPAFAGNTVFQICKKRLDTKRA